MDEPAEWCSLRERDAAAIERAADDVARCFLLESELFERGWQTEWPGEVIGVIGAGAFVAFGDGHEGLLPVRRLRGDWWELDPLEVMLVGAAVGQGDPARRPGDRAGRAGRRAARARRSLARRVVSRRMADIATNKQASYRYHLLEKLGGGLVLTGTEVKSLRGGKAQLKDGYAQVQRRRGLAAQRPHPAVRAGDAREPRARAPAQAADAQARDRAADRQDAREGPHARARRGSTSRARAPRSSSRSRAARTSATSARRSRSAR